MFRPIEDTAPVWLDSSGHPRELLVEWLTRYMEAFDGRHGVSPVTRAARLLLEKEEQQTTTIAALAHQVGTSRSALVRNFTQRYGMSPLEYHTRVRLRRAVMSLQDPGVKVGEAARVAGYRSVKNLNEALKRHTGLKPSDVRGLSGSQLDKVLSNSLRVEDPTEGRGP